MIGPCYVLSSFLLAGNIIVKSGCRQFLPFLPPKYDRKSIRRTVFQGGIEQTQATHLFNNQGFCGIEILTGDKNDKLGVILRPD